MKRTIAFRRQQKQNKIMKAYNIMKYKWGYRDILVARKVADNFTVCSCYSCRNPRRSEWSNNECKLTIQERKCG